MHDVKIRSNVNACMYRSRGRRGTALRDLVCDDCPPSASAGAQDRHGQPHTFAWCAGGGTALAVRHPAQALLCHPLPASLPLLAGGNGVCACGGHRPPDASNSTTPAASCGGVRGRWWRACNTAHNIQCARPHREHGRRRKRAAPIPQRLASSLDQLPQIPAALGSGIPAAACITPIHAPRAHRIAGHPHTRRRHQRDTRSSDPFDQAPAALAGNTSAQTRPLACSPRLERQPPGAHSRRWRAPPGRRTWWQPPHAAWPPPRAAPTRRRQQTTCRPPSISRASTRTWRSSTSWAWTCCRTRP